MKFCTRCGSQLLENSAFCTVCGTPISAGNQNRQYAQPRNYAQQPAYRQAPYQNPQYADPRYANYEYAQPGYQEPQAPRPSVNILDWLTGRVNHFAGGEGAVRPPIRELFSETFQKHTQEQAEEIFACGTSATTPRLSAVDTLWPRPWLYARILTALALAFFMLYICTFNFQNPNTIPGVIMLGAFMVPVSVMVFFFELNTPRNVSFYTVLKIFLVGGCASLLLTLLLFDLIPTGETAYGNAIMVGIIEELGKLGIVAWFLSKEKNAKYHINGLLIGAAVGAGFAAFESAGYAFRIYAGQGLENMIENIFLRAVLAPGGHVVWAAMSGYAIMVSRKYAGASPVGFLSQSRFWAIFWMPVAMHAVWDMPIDFGREVYLVHILLVLLSWVVIFVLIANSLSQLGRVLRNETGIHYAG